MGVSTGHTANLPRKELTMSYYRYITGITKSFRPPTRALRSSSVPRHVPQLDTARYTRSSSVPPSASISTSFFTRNSATPFRDRALSVPPAYTTSRSAYDQGYHYSDFDYKVIDYMGRLERQDMVKTLVSQSKYQRGSEASVLDNRSGVFSSQYNYYDGGKHGRDYLYPLTKEVLGSWKHYNLSYQTLSERNQRATSPLVSRELDRYFGTQRRTDFLGSVSSGGSTDFRHYNYRRVPYLGGSDHFSYLNRTVTEAQILRGIQ